MERYHFERALFVVGEPHAGKSNQLRSMFRSVPLGTDGLVPDAKRLDQVYRLSNERALYLRLTSPHEAGESLEKGGTKNFLEKTARIIEKHVSRYGRRWNFAGALQPRPRNRMPGLVTTCRAFVRFFDPERTRIVFLSPDRHGRALQETEHVDLAEHLRSVPSVEICWIDARDRKANGLLLADFFDFS